MTLDPRKTRDLAEELQSPEAGPRSTRSLHGRKAPLAPVERQLDLLAGVDLRDADGEQVTFEGELRKAGWDALKPGALEVFQVNLGKLCNMTCRHCHVDAGPDRLDAMMSDRVLEACLEALDKTDAHTVDITGGAPELHPGFRHLVEEARARGKHVIDRCNLTILLLPRFRDLAGWLAEHGVEIVASLPHFRERNTDAQRGTGTFQKSREALRLLNRHGYGTGDPARRLTLMSNPAGAFLGGDQAAMEREWKTILKRDHDITFDRLFVLNNMPISRYLEWLVESDNLDRYMARLRETFNPATIPGLMCRTTLSVGWDGRIFDCDFNQMLELDARDRAGPLTIFNFEPERFTRRTVVTKRHCLGCTAGCGSSCGGATG